MAKGKPIKPAAGSRPQARAFASADSALRISAAEFMEWQGDLSNNAAARLLYVSPNTLAIFRANGAPPDIARQCWAINAGIGPKCGKARSLLIGRLHAALDADD